MIKRVLIIHGHPDIDDARFNYRLAESYKDGALSSGIAVKEIRVAQLEFSLLKSQQEYYDVEPVATIKESQELILWAEHILILYPLWLARMKKFGSQGK